MGVCKQAKSKYWSYKFNWNGKPIRESTKQTNKRVAQQMEAAHRTALAKGEVGIRDKKPVPTLKEFAELDFLPFVRSTFSAKEKTQRYYEYGVKALLSFEKLATARLDSITTETIGAFVALRRGAGVQISSINRELQALRRMFHLASEWGKVEKALPTVRMVPGENHRERVLTVEEELLYFAGAKSDAMIQHMDASRLSDVATILLDCGLRPEECFRLRPEGVRDGKVEIQYGKTDNARRRIPMTPRVQAILGMRCFSSAGSEWVFPAGTKSGHIEPSTIKKQHAKTIGQGNSDPSQADRAKGCCVPGLRTGHLTAHVPNPVGTTYGPVDACVSCRTPRHEHHEAVRSSARTDHPRSDGSRRSGKQCAYFKAYRPKCRF
jgi:integrase